MGGCHFKQIVLTAVCCLGLAHLAEGRCMLADKYHEEGKTEAEIFALGVCAVQYNDDESQIKLAEIYMKGEKGVKKSEKDALYMYQLSAENGNAEAQVKLAELLQTFDTSPERRKELKNYLKKLKKTDNDSDGFSGEIQHPYTLLLLAAERIENKWYYPSLNRATPARASALLSNYKISESKRQAAMKAASHWKTRKLLEAAEEVLPATEYPEFEKRLKNNATRSEAIAELKGYLTGYVDKKKKERSLPL